MEYNGEDIPVDNLASTREAGEAEAARVDKADAAAAEGGFDYYDDQPGDDTRSYPLHPDSDDDASPERPEGGSFESEVLDLASQAFADGNNFDDSFGDLLDERVIMSDGGDYTARGRENVMAMLSEQSLQLRGNKIFVSGRHVADAKLRTATSPSGVTRITNIEIQHLV